MRRPTDAEAAELLARESERPGKDLVADVLAWSRRMPPGWQDLSMGAKVARLRRRFGMTQRQLAELSGLPHSKIAKLERGQNVQWRTLAQVLAGLGCELIAVPRSPLSADRLLERTDHFVDRGWIRRSRRW